MLVLVLVLVVLEAVLLQAALLHDCYSTWVHRSYRL